MVDTLHIPYERRLEHPLEEAFAWLTDYQDDDADRTEAIIEDRRVTERTDDRIVLEGQLETLGRRIEGTAVVELDPPDTWTAHLYDHKDREAGTYIYHLEPTDDPDACLLHVDYNIVTPRLRDKLMVWIGRPLIRRQLDKMWTGFEAAMDAELDEA